MKINGDILFKETQHFRVQWLWWLIGLCILTSTGVTIALAIADKQKSAEPWIVLAIMIPVEAAVLYFFYITRLETVISTEGLFFKWWPFQPSYKFISPLQIKKAYLRTGPKLSYGCHWSFRYGTVLNLAPGKGIQLTLKNGRRFFLGTQKSSAFQTALDKIMTVSGQV